ncbi:MAG: hypothetical protein H6970_13120 [Gammaproteobacteria bacterium]|nr:hypothetical protein [Gammaproteobacteria bacterium]MCP5458824.1 hypothetical protein [Gammaproteobacteria bacterium]
MNSLVWGGVGRDNSRWCLDKQAVDPVLRKILDSVDEPHSQRPQRSLHCVPCGHRITPLAARISVRERSTHEFANPHGIAYRIGCFREAPGVVREGTPTDYWSWFPGYRWQIALCRGCGQHLGWSFVSGTELFYGLILNRLVERDDE